jgi:hypothetical protein
VESTITLLNKEGNPGVLVTCESGVCAEVLLSAELVGGLRLVLDYLDSGQSDNTFKIRAASSLLQCSAISSLRFLGVKYYCCELFGVDRVTLFL